MLATKAESVSSQYLSATSKSLPAHGKMTKKKQLRHPNPLSTNAKCICGLKIMWKRKAVEEGKSWVDSSGAEEEEEEEEDNLRWKVSSWRDERDYQCNLFKIQVRQDEEEEAGGHMRKKRMHKRCGGREDAVVNPACVLLAVHPTSLFMRHIRAYSSSSFCSEMHIHVSGE